MKNKKQTIGLIVGLVCVVLLVALLLTMCKGPASEPAPTEPVQMATVPNETETPTEEVTEPPTEPEEETEPTEETEAPTEPTTGGNSRPGGTSGPSYSGGTGSGSTDTDTDTDKEEETVTVSDPGTQGNPYTETLADLPDGITTVAIPENGTMFYHLYHVDGLVLTIEDKNATVIYNETTYTADENGVVTVDLAPAESGAAAPAVLQIGSTIQASYLMNFAEHLGGATNPEILEDLSEIKVTLDESDADGYHYQWTATETGTVSFTTTAVTPETADYDIVLSNGETTVSLSEKGVTDENGNQTISIEIAEGDEISIQVITVPAAEEEKNPAAEIVMTGTVEIACGTAENPEEITMTEIPGSIVTDPIDTMNTYYYHVYGIGGTVLTVEDPDAFVIYNGVTYGASASGVVTVPIANEGPRNPAVIQIGNGGSETESYTIQIAYPVGSQMNPAQLILGENTATVEAGDMDGYYYTWTATDRGTLTIDMDPDASWFYAVNNVTSGYAGDSHWNDDDPQVPSQNLTVRKGDQIQVIVNTYNPEDMWSNPAGDVVFTASFTADAGTAGNPITVMGEFPIVTSAIAPKDEVYYSVYGAGGLILTIDDADAYVIINGVTYTAVDGVVTAEVVSDNPRNPVAIVIGNSGASAESYTANLIAPVGDFSNPAELIMGENTAVLKAGDGDGYFFVWTAPDDGTLTISMNGEASWFYAVSNLTDGITGDNHWSDEEPQVASESVTVGIGDQIQVVVNTYDPADIWNNPAGDVVFNAAFVASEDGKITYKVTLMDYEENPVTNATVQFLMNDTVVAEQAADASGCASVRLPKGEYTVALASTGYYYEQTGALVTTECPTLKLMVADKTVEEVDYHEWTYGVTDYSGYFVGEGATYVELTPDSTCYFRFDPEMEGKYLITTSDPNAELSYWGVNLNYFRDQTSTLIKNGSYQDNGFTISVNATAAANYIWNLGITSDTETSCLLLILPVEEESAETASVAAVTETESAESEVMETVPAEPGIADDTAATEDTVTEIVEEEETVTEATEPTETREPAEEPKYTESTEVTEPEEVTQPVTEPTETAAEPETQTTEPPAEKATEPAAREAEPTEAAESLT